MLLALVLVQIVGVSGASAALLAAGAVGVHQHQPRLAVRGQRQRTVPHTDADLSDADTAQIDRANQARGDRIPTPWTDHYHDG
jgi:hypothetical protein